MFVYLLKCTVNGKGYVGITTTTLERRWASHKSAAKSGRGKLIGHAIKKHGPDAWTVEVLQPCATLDELKTAEIEWIVALGTHVSTGDGYNLSTGGENAAGVKRSAQSRENYRAAAKKRGMSAACRAAALAVHTGRKEDPAAAYRRVANLRGARRPTEVLQKGWTTRRKKEAEAAEAAGQISLLGS